jgi:hypothetical protein
METTCRVVWGAARAYVRFKGENAGERLRLTRIRNDGIRVDFETTE